MSQSHDHPEIYFQLTPDFMQALHEALVAGDHAQVVHLIEPLHAADMADLLNKAKELDRVALITALAESLDPEILPYLEEHVQEEVLELLGRDRFASLLPELESDDVVEVIQDLEEEERLEVLQAMSAKDRAILEQSLHYPEDSAGRMMQREVVVAPLHWSVGQAIDVIRLNPDLPKDFYAVFVVDPKYHPIGVVSVSQLLRSDRDAALQDLMEKQYWPIPVDMDQEEVASLFHKYGLVSAPVINQDDRLVGVITVDDVVEVITEEAEEDIMRLGGVSEQDSSSAIFETLKMRFPWLLVNLVTAFLSSFVISRFENTINHLVELAVLMTIVPALCGNAATQTLTVVIRGMATKEITELNAKRFVAKELFVALVNGVLFAALTGFASALWFKHVNLGITIGIAMIGNFIVAGIAGALIPIGFSKTKFDPAVGSGVFVSAMTDTIGFFLFLGLASLFLL